MKFVDQLRAARNRSGPVQHPFLLASKPDGKTIHTFFEGYGDASFSTNFLNSMLPPGYTLRAHRCGKKCGVYEAFPKIDQNRDRLLQGKPVRGLRQVDLAQRTDQGNRRLTTLREEAGQARTRLVNQVRHILRQHNLAHRHRPLGDNWQATVALGPLSVGPADPAVLPGCRLGLISLDPAWKMTPDRIQ
jgi:hypothetical protein